jgi:holo-[acyl-carrier protein] synthase
VSVLGIGVDAIEIVRMRTALERTPTLGARLFTQRERDSCRSVSGLAARFAAKEAVAKAFGTGVRGFAFVDVEVVNDGLGRPHVELHSGAARLAAELGVARIHLSLTTSGDLAIANAVLES